MNRIAAQQKLADLFFLLDDWICSMDARLEGTVEAIHPKQP
jgi:hypothetical protein